MKVKLPDVTLVAVTSVALEATARALAISLDKLEFAEALLLSDRLPKTPLDARIQWRQIQPLKTRADYSRFVLRQLAEHIATSHVLCVQWDGYVLDGSAWNPGFLDYDYIGAVWPHFSDGRNVGNGGFSLRSMRLLKAAADLQYDGAEPEDVFICRTSRTALEERGIRFAPATVAQLFSYERAAPTGGEFGFHGSFNLLHFLSRREATQLFHSLESKLLNRSEHMELLRSAVKRGYVGLTLVILLRLLRQRQLT
jgi:hypothetical protein